MNTIESQNIKIKNHLLEGKEITSLDALRLFDCLRLSARIHNLRHDYELPIETKWGRSLHRKRFAIYYIKKKL
jgi:hypothetical protein